MRRIEERVELKVEEWESGKGRKTWKDEGKAEEGKGGKTEVEGWSERGEGWNGGEE